MGAARKLTVHKPMNLPERSPQETPKHSPKQVREFKFPKSALMMGVVVFVALFFIVMRFSTLAEAKVELFNMKSEVQKMQMSRDELKVAIDKGLDLEAIEKEATEKLGMQYPTQTQIVYINKTSLYTLKKDEESSAQAIEKSVQKWVRKLAFFEEDQTDEKNLK